MTATNWAQKPSEGVEARAGGPGPDARKAQRRDHKANFHRDLPLNQLDHRSVLAFLPVAKLISFSKTGSLFGTPA